VDPDGLIHAVSPGSAWIVGHLGSLRDSASVRVLSPAASVEFTVAPDSLIVPNGTIMVAVAKDAVGQPEPDHQLTWESSDPAIATAEAGGGVTAVAPGTVTITASVTEVSASTTLHVLPAIATMSLGPAGAVVPVGGTLQVVATTRDAQGNVLPGRVVHWNVSDVSIITIDVNGLVTGVAPGSATVEATAEGIYATLDVSVP